MLTVVYDQLQPKATKERGTNKKEPSITYTVGGGFDANRELKMQEAGAPTRVYHCSIWWSVWCCVFIAFVNPCISMKVFKSNN
jgi:hypothetical protein